MKTPRRWYRRKPVGGSLTRALLTPISRIWAWATARKIARTKPTDAGVAVICVGNLTMGGVGKTPIVRELLRLLTAQGVEAHGLSRGHGGKLAGPVRVNLDRHTAADVGDEPLMLAKDYPIWVSRDRPAGAIAAREAGARAVVMDDGYQNPSLKKTLSLVVVDAETRDGEWPFGDGSIFPAGPMREPLAVGLKRADAVILLLPVDLEKPAADLVALFGETPVLVARMEAAEPPPAGPQLAFAGIGKPWKVERSLQAAGCDLVTFEGFADHGVYDDDVLEQLEKRAKALGAGLVTTEKDWARLPAKWRTRIKAWPVRARFEAEPLVAALLKAAVARG